MIAPWIMPIDLPIREAVAAFERAYFEALLQLWRGNIATVASSAGMGRAGVHRKLSRLGLKASTFRKRSA